MAYRWFLGYDLLEKTPHFSTFGKNYERRFEGTDIFEKIFENEVVKIEAKHYQNELKSEINKDRKEHNKKPLKDKNDDDNPKTKNSKKSTTDPESGIFHKGEHKVVFAYTANTACDKNNFVLGVEVSAGNIHDSVSFDPLYKNILAKFPEIEVLAVDCPQR